MKIFRVLCAGVALGAVAACSSPESRISRNPEVFAGLAAADQQLIREGKVAVGFTPAMVKLALGDPDRVFTRTDAAGVSEVWSYLAYESEDGVLLYSGYYHRMYRDPLYPYFLTTSSRRSREYLRVVFAGGRVSVIERQQ